ncbi:MAG: hypothetical protein J6D12_08575 [Peptostreptococcaceae bacterium]|nr:hypothetical protein [Peptostreptococcaceae bacterium]
MEEIVKNLLEGQGIWATASILLVVYVLRETEKREKRSIDREENLLKIIDGFKDHFGQLTEKVNIIKIDVDDIKEKLDKR